MNKSWTWIVDDAGTSDRADSLLVKMIKTETGHDLSRSQIQKLIETAAITVNRKSIKSKTKLQAGDIVDVTFPEPKPLQIKPENRALEILFQDKHLVVINKPQGLTVHPSATQKEGTLVHALLYHLKDLSGIGGVLRPGIVHRLDKNTSGAMVVTKTDEAHIAMVKIFSRHDIERSYWALCYRAPAFKEKRIESLIGRNPADRKKMSMNVKHGRKAITDVRLIERYNREKVGPFASLIEARLETGRTHQVRVHLTGAGHSLLGDPVYGTPTARQTKWLNLPEEVRTLIESLPGQALHARVLGFEHPITKQKLRFEAEPPVAFSRLLRALRKYKP